MIPSHIWLSSIDQLASASTGLTSRFTLCSNPLVLQLKTSNVLPYPIRSNDFTSGGGKKYGIHTNQPKKLYNGISDKGIVYLVHDLLKGVDALYHLAFIVGEIQDKDETRDININGSRNVFSACARSGSERSSTPAA